ncbi:hypothetical protein M3Y94_00052900 [Aphelenchoides besseyi]|nr:hypothetical protein M3Y94_00052900 [Aphelenchoides besseyi]
MFWCFSTVLFLSVVLGFGSAGDSDECIRKFENAMSRGFDLDDCKDAVLGIKLPKSYGLKLAIKNDEQKSVDFNLTINEVCEVKLEGKKNTNGRWELKTGDRKIRCSYDWCHLEISREGKFTTKKWRRGNCLFGKESTKPD